MTTDYLNVYITEWMKNTYPISWESKVLIILKDPISLISWKNSFLSHNGLLPEPKQPAKKYRVLNPGTI